MHLIWPHSMFLSIAKSIRCIPACFWVFPTHVNLRNWISLLMNLEYLGAEFPSPFASGS